MRLCSDRFLVPRSTTSKRASPKVSLPIAAAPTSVLAVFLFLGMGLLSLAVDSHHSAEASRLFYTAKLASTPLLIFQGAMLLIGAVMYTTNFFFAFVRGSPLKRRVSDVVGFLIFVSSVFLAIREIGPLERAAVLGADHSGLIRLRLIHAGLSVAQIVQQCVSFRNQGIEPRKTIKTN